MTRSLEGKSLIGRLFIPLSVENTNIETPQMNPDQEVVPNSGGQTGAMLAHSELMKQINRGNFHLNFCDRIDGTVPSGETVTPKK